MKRITLFGLIFVFSSELSGSEINVYFTHSVDTTYANPNNAQGFVALDEKLIERIVQSQYSVDFCFYEIERQNIVDSLISAFNRGVAVRVITDDDYFANTLPVFDLVNAGIPVICDTFGNSTYPYQPMHNKFAIFDFRDSSLIADDWIWTGSYNVTDNGTEANANNAIEIQHHELARAYTIEFEEMWGSDSNVPNPDSSKFHTSKSDNTPHNFLIDSIPVELYFSPTDSSTKKICNKILTADTSIDFCIYTFTLQDICDSMKIRWDSGDVMVKGVFDAWCGSNPVSKYWDMIGDTIQGEHPWDPPAPVYLDSVDHIWNHLLHHKYLIIDVDRYSEPILITGSQNWTGAGQNENDENTLIIHSQDIANQYLQEFVERYTEAGGLGCLEKNSVIVLQEIKVSPNPFSKKLRIEGCSEIKVYDVSGRFVTEFKNEWDGRDIYGREVNAGAYFLISQGSNIGKMIKLRR